MSKYGSIRQHPSMNDLSKLQDAFLNSQPQANRSSSGDTTPQGSRFYTGSRTGSGESTPTGRSSYEYNGSASNNGSNYPSPVRPPRSERRPSLGNIALDDIGFGSDIPAGSGPGWDAAVRKLAQARAQAAAAMHKLSLAREQEQEFAPENGLVRFV